MTDHRSELFLSCDLVGSTAFKQRQAARQQAGGRTDEKEPSWQQVFIEFYRDFPRALSEVRSAHLATLSRHSLKHEPEFVLWKPIGDELVFTVRVLDEDTVYVAVRIWLEAMRKWERDRLSTLGMGTKGGAFIATFPGPDRDVAVPRQATGFQSTRGVVAANDDACTDSPLNHAEYLFDYFGPSIDTGFRIFSKATQRRFPISVEVAWALWVAALLRRKDGYWSPEDIDYVGGHEFKGVWGGRDYPLFAIDRHHGDPVNVATKTIDGPKVTVDDAIELCRACIEDPAWPSKIYLPKANTPAMRSKPVDPLADLVVDNQMDGLEEAPADTGGGSVDVPANAPLQ